VDASGSEIVFTQRLSRETNGKLERFYGILEAKWPDFHHDVDTLFGWHKEIKPHMSLNWKELEIPIKGFQRKCPPWRRNAVPPEAMMKRNRDTACVKKNDKSKMHSRD